MSNSFVKDKKKPSGLKKLWKYFVSTFSLNRRKPQIALSKQNSAPPRFLLTAPISSSSSSSLQHHHHHHHHHHYYVKPNHNHDQKLLEAPQKSLSQDVIAYDETSSNNQDQKLLEAPPNRLSQGVIAHDETSSNNQDQKLLEAPPKSLSQDVIAYEETSSKEESNSLGTEIIKIVPQKIEDKVTHIRHVTPEFEFFDDEEGEDEGPGNRISRCDSKYITLSQFQLLGIDARAEEFIQEKKEIWRFEWQKSEQELEQEFREMLARSV
ncbi:hypothetical protein CCACVL1_11339 [Corchorus capsularis]|uniref:Uncharacterized protein n=1 Tax=Corchorus capsularis TaxID=210143 RepID=A0A1R3ILY8_COCAP|nr:hypothetical protein CCACVL1_11339 [Corchorus capsularis]